MLWFDQFWWNFAWQSIFAFPSWWVSKSLRILISKLGDGGQLENWEKFQFSSILYPKTAKKVQLTVFMPNHWNSQTFTISLQTFDQLWWHFARWHISYPEHNSCSMSQIWKNEDFGRCHLKKLSNAISQQLIHWFW